jgi:hypothetical protein
MDKEKARNAFARLSKLLEVSISGAENFRKIERGQSAIIAVKANNHLRDEMMKVFRVR